MADRIELSIRAGDMVVGDRLPSEAALADQFGASRPLVREALAELRARGYVRTLNGRGTFVRHPDAEHLAVALLRQTSLRTDRPLTVDDLYEARTAIETAAAGLAALRADGASLTALDRLLQQMRDSVGDASAYTAADAGFHVMVATASGNPLLPTLLAPLVKLIVEGMLRSAHSADATQAGICDHERLLERLRDHDADAAVEVMRHHLAESRGFFPDDLLPGR